MPGHWQSRPGGYTLADVVTAGLAYSTDSASKHAHTRTQIAAMQFWVQNGRDCRVEYELPFEDPTWDGKLSVDALVLPDTAQHLAAVVVEVTATSAWCSETNKYVHSTKLFFDAIGQATRKRRVLDEGFAAAGYQLPPTRAIVIVTLCAADHQRLWEGLERDADMAFITVRYQGHLFPHLPSAYMQNGMLY
jgi:hypothetical protein